MDEQDELKVAGGTPLRKSLAEGYKDNEIEYPNKYNLSEIPTTNYLERGGKLYRCSMIDFKIDEVTPRRKFKGMKKGKLFSVIQVPNIRNLIFIIAKDLDEAEKLFEVVYEDYQKKMEEYHKEQKSLHTPQK